MILLDTNVISELMRALPAPAVENWLAKQDAEDVFISAITEAELRYGVAMMPKSRRRETLTRAMAAMLAEDFRGKILPFDSEAAVAYAEIAAERRQAGRPISQADAQIAAIARLRNAAIATRNIDDFVGCGVELVNPWDSER